MLDIIKRISSVMFLFLLLISCKNETEIAGNHVVSNKIVIETNSNGKTVFEEFSFHKTELGAVYLDIPYIKNESLNDSLTAAKIIINSNVYDVKIIKQFFDKTIIGNSFFLTIDNKTGRLVKDKIDDKELFLIGFEKDINQILNDEKITVNRL